MTTEWRHIVESMDRTPDDARARKRAVMFDETNLLANFNARSAVMVIEEIETPWHSPPRELFHDDDETRAPALGDARELDHAQVLAKLHDVIARDVRGASEDGERVESECADEGARDRGKAFHDVDVEESELANADEVLKRRLFDAKRKAFQCRGRETKRFERQDEETVMK